MSYLKGYSKRCVFSYKIRKEETAWKTITSYIENKLGLIVIVEKSKIARLNQIRYLGFELYNKKGTWRPKPHLKSVQKFEEKLKDITSRSNVMSIDDKITKLNQVIRGWINYFRIADMKMLMKEIG